MTFTVERLDAFDPADLDWSRLAGWSVATATGGMGSEQKQGIGPPIACKIVTGQSRPVQAIEQAVVFFPHPYSGKNLHPLFELQA